MKHPARDGGTQSVGVGHVPAYLPAGTLASENISQYLRTLFLNLMGPEYLRRCVQVTYSISWRSLLIRSSRSDRCLVLPMREIQGGLHHSAIRRCRSRMSDVDARDN